MQPRLLAGEQCFPGRWVPSLHPIWPEQPYRNLETTSQGDLGSDPVDLGETIPSSPTSTNLSPMSHLLRKLEGCLLRHQR